ncbi:MAG: aspartate--ammonia ligase [Paludibacteraceae bacterium]|nr:aspartate--ammonia ligase [Paludibacteraceae bacterium]
METEQAIKLVKDTFQQQLSAALRLRRVTAPLFVKSGIGLNDDLSGVEQPVRFYVPQLGQNAEIVHSLAKWKRMKLYHMSQPAGYGIYTDMNAIRTFETPDDIHSLYVDQWDWEKVITRENRTEEYLRKTVKTIYNALKNTEYKIFETYPELKPFLPEHIHFLTSEQLLEQYPSMKAKERELAVCKEYGAVFIENIGNRLSNGEKHDDRAADYDDWSLNGDILIWYPILQKPIEISSMGIRVDADSLHNQLLEAGQLEKEQFEYHRLILNNTLPLTIGGGIGQSRLCMLLLHKTHIGQVQVGLWSDEDLEKYSKKNQPLLQ